MTDPIVVLGAGYAGLPAARRLGRQLRRVRTGDLGHPEVILVNASDHFVERPRLHQVGTGQRIRALPLERLLRGSGVRLVVGTARALDPAARRVSVETADGVTDLSYHSLLYALGTTVDMTAVPGLAEHGHALSGPDAAARLARHAEEVAGRGGTAIVVGGGLTGIEVATELADRFPTLRVRLVTASPPGEHLSDRARRRLDRAFARLGIEVVTGHKIGEVRADAAVTTDGTEFPCELLVWAGGFTVPTLARDAGIEVGPHDRIVVDETLRSVSHPDIYALGDAAAAIGPGDRPLTWGCRTGGFTAPCGTDAVLARLTGRTLRRPFRYRYIHECISLGRRDAVIQFLRADESPRRTVLTGRWAVWYKNAVLDSARWIFRHPGPYWPRRRRFR